MTLRLALLATLCLMPLTGHTAEPQPASAQPIALQIRLATRLDLLGARTRPAGWADCSGVTARVLAARASRYGKIIARHAKAQGVEPALVGAVMRVESCFNARAVSAKGARGLMQLMPATARRLGVRNSFDPEQNIRAGVRLLRSLLDRYDGDHHLALAAYNAGPTAVKTHGGVPPYQETRNYVMRVIATYKRNRVMA